MKVTIALTLDGMLRALRWKQHELGDGTAPTRGAPAPPRHPVSAAQPGEGDEARERGR